MSVFTIYTRPRASDVIQGDVRLESMCTAGRWSGRVFLGMMYVTLTRAIPNPPGRLRSGGHRQGPRRPGGVSGGWLRLYSLTRFRFGRQAQSSTVSMIVSYGLQGGSTCCGEFASVWYTAD